MSWTRCGTLTSMTLAILASLGTNAGAVPTIFGKHLDEACEGAWLGCKDDILGFGLIAMGAAFGSVLLFAGPREIAVQRLPYPYVFVIVTALLLGVSGVYHSPWLRDELSRLLGLH